MHRPPTVRVKSANSPDGYIIINESDLTDAHVVVKEEARITEPQQLVQIPSVFPRVAIPLNWEELHWKQQVKLAKALGRQEVPGREISGDEAKAFIKLKAAERAANDTDR